ncbi:MAG TPA: excisionase family DNA-binding protein [Pyrinomonadaceae bacterium]|nr:excisionase family DNA-binding protein [Pyrinomonadaceae bacterium]
MARKDIDGLLTRRQAAKRLGISYSTLSRLMAAGGINFYRIGWRTLFDDAQIEAYLESVTTSTIRHRHAREEQPAQAAA